MPKVGTRWGAAVGGAGNRRNAEEVRQLVVIFKQGIRVSKPSRERVGLFWPTDTVREDVLQKLAKETPASADPLQPESGHLDEDEDTLLEAEGGSRSRCVNWLGLINRDDGHAAVSVTLPATYEPWVTYVNRLIAFLFGDLPEDVIENFDFVVGAKPGKPLKMMCRNPRCVRLSHIDLSAVTRYRATVQAAGGKIQTGGGDQWTAGGAGRQGAPAAAGPSGTAPAAAGGWDGQPGGVGRKPDEDMFWSPGFEN